MRKAEATVVGAETEIEAAQGQVDNGLKSFEKDAKGAIPSAIDCCDYEKPTTDETKPTASSPLTLNVENRHA